MIEKLKSKKAEKIIVDIQDQYINDQNFRPWIIGFSGGKDSTVLLTLTWIAIARLKAEGKTLHRKVYVVCNDTMVENPIITSYVEDVLVKIENAALEQDLPIKVKKTTPKLEESFWINVIGKGYPVPNNSFRWCTDKLKIRPTANFLHQQIDENGEAIVLLGTRYDESASRERSIKKHEVEGERLSKHTTSPNTYVYAPIKELMTEEVWYLINTVNSPWGFDNKILFNIYLDASADDYECPTVVTNKKHTSCGQSRFGCWTCTVVKQDKSMTALVENGNEWMTPLMEFRNKLSEGRNVSDNRSSTRRNGMEAIDEEGHKSGNYTGKYRAEILKELLEVQNKVQETHPHVKLITSQELIACQVIWERDSFFDTSVREIYKEVFNTDLPSSSINQLGKSEERILKEICKDSPQEYKLIDNLIRLQESKTLLVSKHGLSNDIEKRIEDFVTGADRED